MNASDAIDLNADLGEGCPDDRVLLDLVSSASVSCGAHAGDPDAIRRTLADARDRGVAVGAHPGYPDREHFGRRERDMASDAVTAMILDQVAALRELAAEAAVAIRFLKPHGALYNQAQKQAEIARGVADAAATAGLALLGQPGTLLEQLALERAVLYIREGFPDRRYRDDGSLVHRSEPDAILHDPAQMEAHLLRLIAGGRLTTLCIHGDDPRAVDNARLVRRVLEGQGIAVRSFTRCP
jgi:5-oxoprolinase (ATP-hydrolysing) subunit A